MFAPETPPLRDAIEHLYAVFATYRADAPGPFCHHCVTEEDDARLRAVPLRQLTVGQVERYAFKAMTTWGGVNDFRHFLPRILELLALTGGEPWIAPETAFDKLTYGEWRTWPVPERAAVTTYCRALWQDVLSRYPHPFEVDRLLCAIAQTDQDLHDYLTDWDLAGSAARARHFASFVSEHALTVARCGRRAVGGAWWDDRTLQAQQATRWLLDDGRTAEIERAFFTFGDDADVAAELSAAADGLRAMRQAAAGT